MGVPVQGICGGRETDMLAPLLLIGATFGQLCEEVVNVCPPPPPSPPFAVRGSKPNILLWLTDDWSYELWPSVKKADEKHTFPDGRPAYTPSEAARSVPNRYDELLPHTHAAFVAGGVELRTLYTHQICSPSRRSLMSGRFMTTLGAPCAPAHCPPTAHPPLRSHFSATPHTAWSTQPLLSAGLPLRFEARRASARARASALSRYDSCRCVCPLTPAAVLS